MMKLVSVPAGKPSVSPWFSSLPLSARRADLGEVELNFQRRRGRRRASVDGNPVLGRRDQLAVAVGGDHVPCRRRCCRPMSGMWSRRRRDPAEYRAGFDSGSSKTVVTRTRSGVPRLSYTVDVDGGAVAVGFLRRWRNEAGRRLSYRPRRASAQTPSNRCPAHFPSPMFEVNCKRLPATVPPCGGAGERVLRRRLHDAHRLFHKVEQVGDRRVRGNGECSRRQIDARPCRPVKLSSPGSNRLT